MPAFILRFAGNSKLAGLYAADSEDALFRLIDYETNPSNFEYATLGEGFGIEFRCGEATMSYSIGKGEKALDRALARPISIGPTEDLHQALITGEGLTWHSFES